MSKVLSEGNLRFDFIAYNTVERFDDVTNHGMKAVDFVFETNDCLYFIEVKDFQNPNASLKRRKEDYDMLTKKETKEHAEFILGMGEKIKDSLLRKYAEGYTFEKRVVYLLFINLDKLGAHERGLLKVRISGHVPTGLNNHKRFSTFTEIVFDLVNANQLKQYGIDCKPVRNTDRETAVEVAMQEADRRYADTFRRLAQ